MACILQSTQNPKHDAWSSVQVSTDSTHSTLFPCDECELSADNADSDTAATPDAGSRVERGGTGPLQARFRPADILPWDCGRFAMVRTIQDAPRNRGQVHHMLDSVTGLHVAVKSMPNDWVCENHASFARTYPHETERPWVDIGCAAFLGNMAYPYVCPLFGVYRDASLTHVVTQLAPGGDLFGWARACEHGLGQAREAFMQPVALQVMDALRMLHDLSIVHRDVSAENILISHRLDGALQVQLIDFGMATTSRFCPCARQGKPTYQAPEVHTGEVCDGFLADAFAVGVVLYGMLLLAYPWTSTKPGGCKAFDFFSHAGFRALITRRKCFQRAVPLVDCTSDPLVRLLAGLLAVRPADRLTLGECAWQEGEDRRSVWHERWVQEALP